MVCCFFFQAEDGIRDRDVTGVQTCALPISPQLAETEHMLSELAGDGSIADVQRFGDRLDLLVKRPEEADRKSTRLNSSHITISYAVFCLKKKKITKKYNNSYT